MVQGRPMFSPSCTGKGLGSWDKFRDVQGSWADSASCSIVIDEGVRL